MEATLDKKALIVDHENCGACHICELVCSFSKEKVFTPSKSRIRIKEVFMNEVILVCQQCKIAKCVEACDYGALSRDPPTGAIIVNQEKCKGFECGKCLSACPYGAIFRDPKTGIVLICDLCGGSPICTRWCPRGALLYEIPEGKKSELKIRAESKIVAYWRSVKK